MVIDLKRAYRQSGVSQVRNPAGQRRFIEGAKRALGANGDMIAPGVAAPFRTPFVLRWRPGDADPWPVVRPGVPVVLWAYAATAPTTGNALISLTQVTPAGSDPLGSLTILQGERFGQVALTGMAVDAGAWIFAAVTTPNGASGVTIALTINVRD